MSLTISQKSENNIPPIPADSYVAICYMLVDLGVQVSEQYGSNKKVLIGWEIPSLTIEIDGEERPRTITQTYTASLNEKSKLRAILKSWRGREFTKEELDAFNLRNILGAPCILNITQGKSAKTGKVYATVSGVMKLMSGMPKPELSGYTVSFGFGDDPIEKVEDLPNWVKDMVKNSPTYLELAAAQVQNDVLAENQEASAPVIEELEADSEELPF